MNDSYDQSAEKRLDADDGESNEREVQSDEEPESDEEDYDPSSTCSPEYLQFLEEVC